jgi:hypothetical protein
MEGEVEKEKRKWKGERGRRKEYHFQFIWYFGQCEG